MRTIQHITRTITTAAFLALVTITAWQSTATADVDHGVAPGHGTWVRGDLPTAQDAITAKACNARATYQLTDSALATWLVDAQGATAAQAATAVQADCA